MRSRWLSTISVLAGLALSAFGADEALATRRVALIIGNAKYEHAGVLANTLNDAHAVANLLKQAKFDVVDERDDLGVVEMKRVVRDFAATASNADISVIYYSGHGMEAAGINYLVPVDARLANAEDVEDETLPLDRLLWASSSAKSLSLIILDACRENPFLSGGGAVPMTRGVAAHPIGKQATSANTLIAYAAKAGSVSFDGAGQNSPFTTALVKHIAEPGVDIRIAFGQVRDDVLAATGNQQEPFVYGSLGGATVSLSPAVAKTGDPLAATAADYAMAERVGSPEAYRAFLQAHREGGFYVDLARAQLNRTGPSAPTPTRTVAPPSDVARLETAPPSEEERCKAEGAQLAALRNGASADAVSAFAAGMACTALRPQLSRLMESVGLVSPPVPPTPPAMTNLAVRNPEPAGCDAEGRELERLRAEPDAAQTKALFDRLTCETLRPQVRRMMESLGVETPPVAASSPLARTPAPAAEDDAALCAKESGALSRLRAAPDRKAALAFAAGMRCSALKPQAARLLESFGD